MTKGKGDATERLEGQKRMWRSDFAKVDASVNGPSDYAEIPELTEEDFARGTIHRNGVPIGEVVDARRGRGGSR